MPAIIVAVGDLHVGSTTAICPPQVRLDDGGQYQASVVQSWYWRCWQRLWDQIAAMKKKLGARLIVISGGDEIEGDHHQTTQVWFVNEADQERALSETYERPMALADGWIFIRGTVAHDGPIAARTEARLQAWKRAGVPILTDGVPLSHWIWTGVIEQVRIQAKHQPTTYSRLVHTRESAAQRQAHQTWLEYTQNGSDPPDVALFFHVHHDARGDFRSTTAFFVPGWQAPSAWAWRRQASPWWPWPGALILVAENGFWHADFQLYKPERSPW